MSRSSLVLAALVATLSCTLFSHAQQTYNCNLGPRANDAAATAYAVAEGWDVAGAPRPCMTFWDTTLEKARCWDATIAVAWVDCDAHTAHVASSANPHATDIGNLGVGTIAELAAATSDGDAQPQRGNTLYVDSVNGSDITPAPWGYATMAAALNVAGSGDTVEVYPGSYTEDVSVPEGVHLVASEAVLTGQITLDGSDSTVHVYTQFVPTGETGVTLAGVNKTGFATIERQICQGTADGTSIVDSGSVLFFKSLLQVVTDGEGKSSTAAGSEWVDITLISIQGTGTGLSASATGDVGGRVEMIDDDGAGTCIEVLAGGAISIAAQSLSCNTAYDVAATAELVLSTTELSGAEVCAGTCEVFIAGNAVSTSTAMVGDVTGTIGATVVGDDSHSHGNGTLTGVPGGGIDTTAVHSGDAAGGGLGGTYPNPTVTAAAGLDTTAAHYADGTAGYLPVYGAAAWSEVDPSTLGGTFAVDVDLSGAYDWQAEGVGSEDPTSGFTANGAVADATTLEVGSDVVTFDLSGGGTGTNRTVFLTIPLGTDADLPGLYEATVISLMAEIDLAHLDNQNNCEITFRISNENLHTVAPSEQATIRVARDGGAVKANLTREINDSVTSGGYAAWAGWANAARLHFRDGVGRMTGTTFEPGSNTATALTTVAADGEHVRGGGTGAPFLGVTITAIGHDVTLGRVAGTISALSVTLL